MAREHGLRARGPRLIDTEFEDGHRYYTKEAHVADLAEPDTAFSNRGYLLWLNFAMRWDDPADDADYIGRTRMIVAALAPLGRPGCLRQHAQLRRAGPRR